MRRRSRPPIPLSIRLSWTLFAWTCLWTCLPVAVHAGGPEAFDRAARLTASGDVGGAVGEYQEFLARNPDDRLAPVAAVAAARLQLASGDTAGASSSFRFLLEKHPESTWTPDAARNLAAFAAAKGEWSAAAAQYEAALRFASAAGAGTTESWAADVAQSVADCYQRAGEPGKAVDACRRILDSSPPPELAAAALFRLSEASEAAGDSGGAAAGYADLILKYPTSARFEAAVRKRGLIDRHRTMDWRPVLAYVEGGRALRGDLARVLALSDSVLALAPSPGLRECAEYRKLVVETALRGDYGEGCRRMQEFIDRYPDGLRTRLARTTLEENWKWMANLEQQLREKPDDPDLLLTLGQLCHQARADRKAAELLEKAHAIRPDDLDVQLELGYIYIQAGRNDEALRMINAYLERNPKDPGVLNTIGYTCLNEGKPQEAVSWFERYAALSPDDPNAHDSLGEGYLGAGRLEDSARQYEQAVALNASFANSWFMLGRVYTQLEKPEKAASAYRRFLELTPTGEQADEARGALETLGKPGGQQ